MPILRTSVLLAAALLALSASSLRAQTAVITGFDDLDWGASRDSVTTYWRETPAAERRERGVSFLTFKPWEGMSWVAGVDDRDGFVYLEGTSLPFSTPAACEALFDRYVAGLVRRFAGITPIGGKSNPGGGKLCDNVRSGTAQAVVAWRDPVNGAASAIRISEEGQVIWTMGTASFQRWRAAGRDAAPSAAADPSAAGTASAIEGFDSRLFDPRAAELRFAWGTPRAEIERALGRPLMTDERDLPAGTGDLLYTDDDGHGLAFTIDPAKGLVRGVSSTGLAGADAPCAEVWERLRARIAARMPGVTPRGGMVNPRGGDLCQAVKEGTAFAEMVWTAADGSALTLRIGERSGGISIIATSAGFQRWFESSPLGRTRAERIRRAAGGAAR